MGWLPSLQNLDDDHWKVPARNSSSYSLEKNHCLYPNTPCGNPCYIMLLIGGLEHVFSHSVGNVIIPTVTHSIIFQRGRYTTNQCYFLSPQKSRIEMTTSHGISGYHWETCDHSGCLVAQEFSKFRRGHPEAELMGLFIRGWLSQSWRCCYGDMVMKGEIFDFFMGKSTRTPNRKNCGKDTMGLPKLSKKNLRK